jgi:hypothetical protein
MTERQQPTDQPDLCAASIRRQIPLGAQSKRRLATAGVPGELEGGLTAVDGQLRRVLFAAQVW